MAEPYFLPTTAKAGTIYLSKKLDTTKDIVVSFQYACYGSAPIGSEGFSVFFYNSFQSSLSGGGPGPGLCYTPVYNLSAIINNQVENVFGGVQLGQLGVGFDLTGNYGTSAFGLSGLNSGVPNSITIRGSQIAKYNSFFTSENLSSSSFNVPLSLYQSVSSIDDIKYYTIRIRLTDFCKRIYIDCKHPDTNTYINYIERVLPENWPASVNCCLSFATGLIDTCFSVKNFNVNGIFTELTEEPVVFNYIYCGAFYLGQIPNPMTLTINDTITIQNAPPWDNYPPLILINQGGLAPLVNEDGYISIINTGTSACNVDPTPTPSP